MPPVIELNLINNPDLFQTFAFYFAVKGCQVLYSGLDTLHLKETDRIKAVKNELAKIGVNLVKLPPSMSNKSKTLYYMQEGKANFDRVLINTYHDHRMAMGASLLAVTGEVEIENCKVVNKSYPDFFKDLKNLISIV
jgi:3-phosphoshikimate 1-carboxyvinyltransferase